MDENNNKLKSDIIETKSGKKYCVEEKDDSFICVRTDQNSIDVAIPKYWVSKLIYPLSITGVIEGILNVLDHKYYVVEYMYKSKTVPVFGCDTKEGCRIWIENNIGEFGIIKNNLIL